MPSIVVVVVAINAVVVVVVTHLHSMSMLHDMLAIVIVVEVVGTAGALHRRTEFQLFFNVVRRRKLAKGIIVGGGDERAGRNKSSETAFLSLSTSQSPSQSTLSRNSGRKRVAEGRSVGRRSRRLERVSCRLSLEFVGGRGGNGGGVAGSEIWRNFKSFVN